MSSTLDIEKRNFSDIDTLLKYLSSVNEKNIIPTFKTDIEYCFSGDARIVCFSAKSEISLESAQEVLLEHIGDELNKSFGVVIIYHIPLDYSLIEISKLLEKIEAIMDKNKCIMFSTYQDETIFGAEFIFNFS